VRLAAGYPKRGDVYVVRLDKDRPALILSIDALNKHSQDVCIVPITSISHGEFEMRVPLKRGDGGLHSNCWAKCDQVTTIEQIDLVTCIGTLAATKLRQIEHQVRVALGFA
jgi:mRNA-degrading endonuclease toxin of MazEF toxin-antitoxin module